MSESREKWSLRTAFRRLLGDAMILVAACLVAEAGVRVLFPQEAHRQLQDVWVADDTGFRYRPGAETLVNNGFGDHEFRVNNFRARDRDLGPKGEGEFRICCVGDSFSDNVALDLDEIWPKVLERELRTAQPARHFTVLNAGQAGWGLWARYEYLDEMLERVEPDLVILSLAIGKDSVVSTDRPGPRAMALWRGLPVPKHQTVRSRAVKAVWYVNQKLEEISHAYVALRKLTSYAEIWLGISRVPGFNQLCADPAYADKVVEPTSEVLLALKERCREAGAGLVLMSIPRDYECQPNAAALKVQLERPDLANLDVQRPARTFALVAERTTLPHYDPGPDLVAAEGETYLPVFAHWNRLGNEVVARGLLRFLEQRQLLERAEPL